MAANILVISELKPEAAYDPHCFQMTEVTNNYSDFVLKNKAAIIKTSR